VEVCRVEEPGLAARGDMTCMLWDVETGSKVTEFADHLGDVMSISINPTNQHVFISGGGGMPGGGMCCWVCWLRKDH